MQYFLYLLLRVYTSYPSLRIITYDFSNIQFLEKKFYFTIRIGIKNFLKSLITPSIIFRDRDFILIFQIQLFEMNSRFAVTCHEGERIMRNSCRRKDRGSFDYRQNSIHQFVLKREPCCIIGSYKYKLKEKRKKPGIQLWGRTSGNVIYSQIRKDNRDAFSFHLTRELIMSFIDLSVGSASRHAGTEALFPRNPSIPSLKYVFLDTKIQRNYESLVQKGYIFKWLISRCLLK